MARLEELSTNAGFIAPETRYEQLGPRSASDHYEYGCKYFHREASRILLIIVVDVVHHHFGPPTIHSSKYGY
jgi:hypothetical protein